MSETEHEWDDPPDGYDFSPGDSDPVSDDYDLPPGDYDPQSDDYNPPPREPTAAEHWQTMAAHGDVRGLLYELEHAHPGVSNLDELAEILRMAIEVLARSNPAAFAALMNEEILATAGKLVIRSRLLLEKKFRQLDEEQYRRRERISTAQCDELADRVVALDMNVLKLLHAGASTQKVLEQARKLRIANDKAEAKKTRPRQPTRRRRLATTRSQPVTASSRLGEGLP